MFDMNSREEFKITSGEYIQMSGRAGRRGKDERGIVVLVIDERMSPNTAKEIVKVRFIIIVIPHKSPWIF